MREILFRGKPINNGKWVFGCYYKQLEFYGDKVDDHIIITSHEDLSYDQQLDYCDVKPETVGQFTGLTDKNGRKIFEGDIVRCIRTMCDEKEMVGHIVYDDCCFSVKENKTPNQPAMDLCDDFEVIGNIHDNPELIGGKGNA